MLAALLGWAQGTFASEGRPIAGETGQRSPARSTAGLRRSALKMPAIVTVDLRLNEPRYASLPNIMKAKSKPLAQKGPADYGVDVAPRLEDAEGRPNPPVRLARRSRSPDVDALVDKLKDMGIA